MPWVMPFLLKHGVSALDSSSGRSCIQRVASPVEWLSYDLRSLRMDHLGGFVFALNTCRKNKMKHNKGRKEKTKLDFLLTYCNECLQKRCCSMLTFYSLLV